MEFAGATLTVVTRESKSLPIFGALAAMYLILRSFLSLVGRWLNVRFALRT